MRRNYCLAACAFYVTMASILLLHTSHASASDPQAAPQRGIAVLASGIGNDYSPENLAALVQEWQFSPIVIDWAWITAHWDQTNFTALNRFIDLMAARGVPVAAMYRPRLLNNPTVPIQVDREGNPSASHGSYICFSSSDARQWGIAWGTRILQQCPRISEIIIYNPLNQCECAACREAAQGNPYAHYDAVWRFLAEAKAAWQRQQSTVKLGVVFVNDPEFWRRGTQVLDVAHPFLFIMDDTDMARDAAEANAIRALLPEKMGSCLAKITWGATDKVSPARLAEFDRSAAEAGLPYFFWTADTLFDPALYDQEAVATVLRANPLEGATQAAPPAQEQQVSREPDTLTYTLEQIRSTSAKEFMKRLLQPEPGYWQFAALKALSQKARESDAATRDQILSQVIATMNDRDRPIDQRWQCCYVISDSQYDQGVPDLIQVLLYDESEVVRSVAAEALAAFPDNAAAHDALLQAARQETNERVREVLTRRLGPAMPVVESRSALDMVPAPALATANASVSTSSSFEGITNPPGGFHRGDAIYTPEEIRRTSMETFLEWMLHPQEGYGQFAAMNALAQKAKESDPAARERILSFVIRAMQDKSRPVYQRWQCCYVLSGSEDERVIPDLIQVLLHDESEVMRAVAVDALAQFPQNEKARNALLEAARQETNESVRETLSRNLGQAMLAGPPPPAAVKERAPEGPPVPPPGPTPPVPSPLPWPFPGNQESQHIFNNYQQATDIYIHCGLDFIHPAGTPVTAVASGYVAAIFTNYPDWITHYFFIVTPEKGGNEGWCYTHLDPRTYTFREGDFVQQGQNLGSLVDFSVGNQPGVAHLHLHYVRFARDGSGEVKVHSLLDPLYFFGWNDTESPVFQPLRLVSEGTTRQFQADAAGMVTVSGRVDILAAVTDSAFPGHMGNLGVPVVMVSISDGKHTMQKLVVDHRGDVGDETQVEPLYLSYDQKKAFFNPDSFPRYQMLRVTKTDDDGKITPRDARECWDTTARDDSGEPLWPDGEYSVNVYAWDISGNRAAVGAVVQIRNR